MNSELFTASQIARVLDMTPQFVRKLLDGVQAADVRIVAGNEAAAWTVEQLPAPLRARLDDEAKKQHCIGCSETQRIETLLSMPRRQYQPPVSLDNIHDDIIEHTRLVREAFKPWLVRQHDAKLSVAEMESAGVEDYRRIVGNQITPRYWHKLFKRILGRDNGAEEWNRLELYLPERLKEKNPDQKTIPAALAKKFAEIESVIKDQRRPEAPNEDFRLGVWTLALKKFTELVNAGVSERSAGRQVRQFLFARARFLAASRDALLKAFARRLEAFQSSGGDPQAQRDGRVNNGDRPEYPRTDIERVRHSAFSKNGARIDAAWREEYPHLSEYTRRRHPQSRKCPRAFYELANRKRVDALYARLQGKRTLRKLVGFVTRDKAGIPAMADWVVDDMTSNIEVEFRNPDGTVSLITPQIIIVMDSASHKAVGRSISNDKAPTAKLVCEAVLDGFKRHDVPTKLWLENGFVFGKALNVNGKEDERGRTVVAGLAQYGCTIHHFEKMNPTSKAELEKSFDLVQRRMERHPGYTGRLQMLDAPEDFKREQRLIRSGKVPAAKFRYTFVEFFRVLDDIIEEYNAEPQFGQLRGLSPNEAFEALKDPNDLPIQLGNDLHWMLANERYRVEVRAGGVTFRHYGRKIQVRGGELAKADRIGIELWALVDRKDDSMVTFMSLDYRETFTVETCRNPSSDESRMAPGSGVLGAERGKIGEHMRAVETEFTDLTAKFGNSRHDLLAKYRGETHALDGIGDTTTRRVILNSRIEASAEQMLAQREAITAKRRQNTANKSRARRLGVPTIMVDDDEQSRRALELRGERHTRTPVEAETPEGLEQ